MTQKGTHTWDLYVAYHRCPHCGYIMESRENFKYRLRKYTKDLECPRCHYLFTLIKPSSPSLGPLIGEAQPPEFDWSA